MTLQLNEGRLTHPHEFDKVPLTHPFLFSQGDGSFTDMLPWGKVSPDDSEVECREHCPEGG